MRICCHRYRRGPRETGWKEKGKCRKRCGCLRNRPTAPYHGVHLLVALAMAKCRGMHEKVTGDKWERKFLLDSRLSGVWLCPRKMNERVYTPLMRFIVLI